MGRSAGAAPAAAPVRAARHRPVGHDASEITPELQAGGREHCGPICRNSLVLRALQRKRRRESGRPVFARAHRRHAPRCLRRWPSAPTCPRASPPIRSACRHLLDTADSLATALRTGLVEIGPGMRRCRPAFATARARLPLPVQSVLLRGFNEADAAGTSSPRPVAGHAARRAGHQRRPRGRSAMSARSSTTET